MKALPFRIFAIGDLHLSFGIPNKSMEVFGENWKGWSDQIAFHWKQTVQKEDLVLIPGDISWAMRLEEALPDLEWIDHLPGIKVLIKGNHDYWWSSKNKIQKILPPSLHILQNDSFHFQSVAISGARLWDTQEFRFSSYIDINESPSSKALLLPEEKDLEKEEALFQRELGRLELSLKAMDPQSPLKICMTHYPPIGANLQDSRASQLLERYGVSISIFGHLHNVKKEVPLFGKKGEIHYFLTSCDYLHFKPLDLLRN